MKEKTSIDFIEYKIIEYIIFFPLHTLGFHPTCQTNIDFDIPKLMNAKVF